MGLLYSKEMSTSLVLIISNTPHTNFDIEFKMKVNRRNFNFLINLPIFHFVGDQLCIKVNTKILL